MNYKIEKYGAERVEEWLNDFCSIYKDIFSSALPADKLSFILAQKNLLVLIAYEGGKPVAFKAGYCVAQNLQRFYSWAGGTIFSHRTKGIASQLMHIQHENCKDLGVRIIETKCKPKWAEMMSLNKRFGFKIIKEYLGANGDLKYLLEKTLD